MEHFVQVLSPGKNTKKKIMQVWGSQFLRNLCSSAETTHKALVTYFEQYRFHKVSSLVLNVSLKYNRVILSFTVHITNF